MDRDVLRAVVGQLDIWWYGSVTIRMDGLTDDEFFWKPVPDAFCLRREADGLHYEWPPGSRGETTPPVTTIAWRLAHIAQGCFVSRWYTHFTDETIDPYAGAFPDNAKDALAYLEEWKNTWQNALLGAGNERLWAPIGPDEYDVEIMQLGAADPFIGVAMHMNREVMHHGAEICLLRDLYRASSFG